MRIKIKGLDQPLSFNNQITSLQKCAICLALLALLSTPGCRILERDSDSIHSSIASREISPKAIFHNSKGLKYLSQGKTGKAETHFLKAIDYDSAFAAAHNNLGNMLLSRRDLYQAAWEFHRASELEPNSIEPLVNLGLIHDEADRLEEAAEFYQQALQINPRSPIALGNLVRVRIKQDNDPIEIHNMLRELVLLDSRREWVDWAQELLATRYRPDYGSGLSDSNIFTNPSSNNWEQSAVPYPTGNSFRGNNSSPGNMEQVQPAMPVKPFAPNEETLPSPVYFAPNPVPTLMDIPTNRNGYLSYPVNETPQIQLQSYQSDSKAMSSGAFNASNPQNGFRP